MCKIDKYQLFLKEIVIPVIAELSPEEEKELIDEMAQYVHKFGMGTTAILFLESSKGVEYLASQMGRVLIGPYFNLMGINKLDKVFAFLETKGNLERLIKRVEELVDEEKKKEKEMKETKKERNNIFSRFLNRHFKKKIDEHAKE